MSGPLVFIPPSESKAEGGESSFLQGHGKYRNLATRRERVLAGLEKAMKGTVATREKILKVKGDALAQATALNLQVRSANLTMPAAERYTGVLYQHLGWATLPDAAKRAFRDHVVIVDGLLGLVAPSDEIPNYKLPIDATLPEVEKLTEFWRDPIGLVLEDAEKGRPLWDLLPESHRRAIPKDVEFDLVIDFVDVNSAGARAAGHGNKAAKGVLLRRLAEQDFTREVLEGFSFEGFAYDAERSDARRVVFARRVPDPAPEPAPEPARPAAAPAGAKAGKAAGPAKARRPAKAARKPAPARAAKKPVKTAKKGKAKKARKRKA